MPANSEAALLERTPKFKAFLESVGAVQKSFRRYVIEGDYVYGRQRKAVATLRVSADGDVTISGDLETPPKEMFEAFATEIRAAGWPKSTDTNSRDRPKDLDGIPQDKLFRFLSCDGNRTLFIQHRIDHEDGSKSYVPYSYWNDGVWRRMEPDGDLPLFGLDRLARYDGATVFLHEGAKAARHIAKFIELQTKDDRDAYDACPWSYELSHAAHLGWIGGADNPGRTDWGPLHRLPKSQRIIVVADNDSKGKNAVSAISRILKRSMTAILFDDDFPEGFDLANPWPKHPSWWTTNNAPENTAQTRRYLGPSMRDLSSPATWATIQIDPLAKGKKAYAVRPEFADEWLVSKSPHLFVNMLSTNAQLTADVFNRTVAPFSDVEDTARLLVKNLSVHADGITYQPVLPERMSRLLTRDGRKLINTYRPPTTRSHQGDAQPFLDFMGHLIPDDWDRSEVLKWCATLIAMPHVRMRYGLLLISERQGVGKTTLSDAILSPLVGKWNVSYPTEQQITETTFNSWLGEKRLIAINEIYSGGRSKAYERLKPVITDDTVSINKKFVEPYELANFAHVIACSNSLHAIHVDAADRRFLVPRLTEQGQAREYWDTFYAWLSAGGLSAIAGWAAQFIAAGNYVRTGDRAPETQAKFEVISASRSEGQRLAVDLAEAAKFEATTRGRPVVLVIDEVRAWVAAQRSLNMSDSKLETAFTLRKALREGGLHEPGHPKGAKDNRVRMSGGNRYIVSTTPIAVGTSWKELSEYHVSPEELLLAQF